ncbi:MAG: hypothetical protein RIT45_1046 [Pseudomonadota bacterium]|jgi:predicted Ser/Thr protein kinase
MVPTQDEDDQTRPLTARAGATSRPAPSAAAAPVVAAAPLPMTPATSAEELLARGVLDGRYRLVDKLGQGGMGSVFLVDDLLLRRRVALKTLRLDAATGVEDLERFRKEAAITHAINHSNVARTYDIGEEDGVHYMSMEWLDGETLMDRIRARGKLGPGEVRSLAVPLCLGLRAAHRAGIVHRDLKPANIMLVPDERQLVVMDFGIAGSISETRSSIDMATRARPAAPTDTLDTPWDVTSAGRGTPAYMAPEQWDEESGDARTDIYAFGVILYVALTAKAPFRGRTPAEIASHHRETPPPDVRQEVPSVDRDLSMLIQRCMAKRPSDRPSDMDEVLDVLRRGERRRAWARAWLLTALITAALTFALDAAVFGVVSRAVLAEMKPGMARLAELVARDLDPADLDGLRGPDDMKGPAFERVHGRLARAKRDNRDIKGLYVMRKTDRPMQYRFVADAEPYDHDDDGDGTISDDERGAETGRSYDGSPYPAMQRVLETGKPQTDQDFAVDAWGISLSGYAPIAAPKGVQPTMFVGVDVGNAQLTALRTRLHVVLGAVAALIVLAAGLLTFPLDGGSTLWRRLIRRKEPTS